MCATSSQSGADANTERAPEFLLIVRERVHAGREQAYASNEAEIAAACVRLKCPHPYLALVSLGGPQEVWWLSAFSSLEEKAKVERAYASNAALMAQMQPLGARKNDLRHVLSETLAKRRPDLSGDVPWRLNGARFVVIIAVHGRQDPVGPVFEAPDGRRFVVMGAENRAAADVIAARGGPGAVVLAVEPRWSFPDPAHPGRYLSMKEQAP